MSSLPLAARPPSVHSTTSSSSTMPPSFPSPPSNPEKVTRPSPRDPSPSGTLAEGGGGPTAEPANPEKEAAEAYLVEFDSETDEYHPWSLPIWRKWAAVLIVSSSSLCVTCASSMGASTYAGIEREFSISQEIAILNVSLFVLGLSFGPLLLGPFSEFFGRNKVYYVSLSSFVLLNFPVAFANNAPVHLIFRFLTAFAGSAFLSVAAGTVSDMFSPATIRIPMAVYSMSPFLGPVVGPVMAGFINQNTSWRWTYYLVIIWSSVQLLLLIVLLPETHHPTVLKSKAHHVRQSTGDDRWTTTHERSKMHMGEAIKKSCQTPFVLMATEPMVLLLNVWTAVLLAILYLDFNAIPIVFRQHHGFNQQMSGLCFLGLGVGILSTFFFQPLWKSLFERDAAAFDGKLQPEAHLRQGMLGALLCPLSLFLFAATSLERVHWIVPIIMSIPFGMGIVFVFTSVFGFLVSTYRPVAASAMASNTFLRCLLSTGFPLFANQMYARLGTVGAGCVLGGICTILAPLPFAFFKYGPKLRQNSKYTP